MAKKKRSSEEKGVYIPLAEREPYDKENIKLSKAQFVEKQRIKKERALKVKEYEEKLKRDAIGDKPEVKISEVVEPKPKMGRPKKID